MRSAILLLMLGLGLAGLSQQSTRISQYAFNHMLLHPAAAGDQGDLSIFTGLKSLWNGVDGAPQTQFLTAQGTIKRKRIGWGVEIQNDQVALLNQKKLIANGSFRIRKGYTKWLAFGAGFGIKQHTFDGSKAVTQTPDDIAVSNFFVRQFKPAANISAIYFSDEFFAAISVDNAIKYKLDYSDIDRLVVGSSTARINISGGYNFKLSRDWVYKQMALIKIEFRNPYQIDFTPQFEYKNVTQFGLSYRHKESVSFIFQYQINDQFRVGYAYDYQLNEINVSTNGSHELFLKFTKGRKKAIFSNPRFF